MKRIFTLLFTIFFLITAATAQQPRPGERVEALKIAYLTKKLNLTTDEAQRFWPVYNAYMAELKKVRIEGRSMDELEKDEKVLAVRKKYYNDFSKALNPEKANQFFRYEKEFYGFVAKELQDRKDNRQHKQQD
ncbi:hypothetical protein [Flavihumibacter petaseus]|uniref:Uncharacterized protein n=1 Tax=Flavihumibacter petaseus NBRC 106054 TaxID=1220578 RepID=A0A0E9N5L6_9BACT|nr:hypothetical protein [Flavihumibacter petaseus]GAO45098.1 hypothetical protein FPE01S_04_03410 [Flavihumibacter petaseus NBRC 106054]